MVEKIRKRRQQIRTVLTARHVLPIVILTGALLVTYTLWRDARRITEQTLQAEFTFRVHELNDLIVQRMQIYEQVLRGIVGLFVASDEVSREDFNRYVSALRLEQHYPGIQGAGFAVLVPPAQKAAHVAAMRAAGFPEYAIKPAGERDLYSAIIYIEPFSGRNLRAFGYDMFSEPVRHAAMAEARDNSTAVVSAKTTLVQETDSDVQSGFLMYLPVYRNGVSHDSVPARRANLFGWVYAPFRMRNFMQGIRGQHGNDLDIDIYDGATVSEAAHMYDSNPNRPGTAASARFKSVERIDVGSHQWTVVVSDLPAFGAQIENDRSTLILRGGISISLLLAVLVWVFLDDRALAIQAADQAYRLALYDTLTGLPNRTLFTERLTQALHKARRNAGHVALLFIDLDRFKPVNDEYGHAVGDLLLKEVAKRLQACMRESDTPVRFGGDEFVALLQDVDGEASVSVAAEKILHALGQPFEIAGHRFDIGASIGAAIYPEHATDGKALLKCADMAMYAAKNSGRNNVKFARA